MKSNSLALTPLVAAIALANSQYLHAVANECPDPFIVNTLLEDANDNELSIYEAFTEVNSCSNANPIVIQISDTLAGNTIDLPNSINLDGLKTVTVEGPASKVLVTNSVLDTALISVGESSQLTIKNVEFDGENEARTQAVLQVSGENSSLELDNVIIKNTLGTQGGAAPIYTSESSVTLKNSEINSNSASGTSRTAGIYSIAGDLVIEDTIFNNNSANADSTSPAGGAIYHSFSEYGLGSLNIKRGEFTGNSSRNYGGAIHVYNADSLIIEDSVFEDNGVTAAANEYGTGDNAEAHGGAISIQANTPTTISNTTFKGNSATNYGGALYIKTSSDAQVSISDSTFDDNSTSYSASEATIANGGAIYLDSNDISTLKLNRSTISNNSAYGNGGALYVKSSNLELDISSSTISGNSAKTGAGIFMTDGLKSDSNSTIAHSTIVNNSAADSSYTIGAIKGDGDPHLTITHTIISNNFGSTGQLCVSESSTAYTLDHVLIDNGDVDVAMGCTDNTDNGGNQIGTSDNPIAVMLEDLADNGGATLTHYPQLASPAVDAGNTNLESIPDTDQRNNDRVMRASIDIGAVEYGNLAPTLTNLEFEDPELTDGDTINIDTAGFFSDIEGDSLTFTATGLPQGASISTDGIISGVLEEDGDFTIIIEAEDIYGASAVKTINISVEYLNLAPTVNVFEFEDPELKAGDDINIDASEYFSDPEGDVLSYAATGLPGGASISENGLISGVLNESGDFNVTIRATDTSGEFIETSISISIEEPSDESDDDFLGAINAYWFSLLALLGLARVNRNRD